ncbi:hypothetical protein [Geodermatophilus sp. SYSU D00815]
MHVELARALVPVVHDLTATGAPVPRVVDDGWSDDPGTASAMLWSRDGTHGSGVGVRLGAPRHEQLVHVADQVQEWAFDELRGTAATNWPRCPHHPATHPLQAAVRDGAARWVCPRDGTAVAVVGGLR